MIAFALVNSDTHHTASTQQVWCDVDTDKYCFMGKLLITDLITSHVSNNTQESNQNCVTVNTFLLGYYTKTSHWRRVGHGLKRIKVSMCFHSINTYKALRRGFQQLENGLSTDGWHIKFHLAPSFALVILEQSSSNSNACSHTWLQATKPNVFWIMHVFY